MARTGGLGVLPLLMAACSGGIALSGDEDADAARDGRADVTDADGASDTARDEGSTGPCAAQDARASGPCGAILPGVVFDGAHCVPLGSGCECLGADCDALYDTVTECAAARLGCYGGGCAPQEVWDDRCEWCDPDEGAVLGVFWDGRGCFELLGCSSCVGPDCAGAFVSVEECEAVHAGCDAVLCRTTGGRPHASGVDPCVFTCGLPDPPPGICDATAIPCDCGPGRSFATGAGCLDDPACDETVLCTLSGGTWHPESDGAASYLCGTLRPCDAFLCDPACDCGTTRNFAEGLGCVPDLACPGADPASICRATGGRIPECREGGPCPCEFDCGVAQSVCVAPGCDCGSYRRFDEALGCVYDAGCVLRGVGDPCAGGPSSRNCRAGLVCCSGCGMPLECPHCSIPCCPDNPTCMEDACTVPTP
jgi:hypothetical protein